jgi:cysteine protease ATG4
MTFVICFQLPKMIFSIQDEPPSWPSDSDDMGLESMSDVDDDFADEQESEQADKLSDSSGHNVGNVLVEDKDDERFDDSRPSSEQDARKSESSYDAEHGRRSQSEEGETEDDAVAPLTPGPGTATHPEAFAAAQNRTAGAKRYDSNPFSPVTIETDEDTLGDEGWVDSAPGKTPQQREANLASSSRGSVSSSSSTGKSKSRGSSRSKPSRSSTVHASSRERERDMSHSHQAVFVPFPVVDDRDEGDESYIDAGDEAETPQRPTPRSRPTSQIYAHGHHRQRTESARMIYPSVSANGKIESGGAGSGGGNRSSALKNQGHGVRARDGGRTQSGGVRGISIVPKSRDDSESASDA